MTFVGLEHIESRTGRRTGSMEVNLLQLTGRKPRFQAGDIVYGYLRPYLNKVWVAEFPGLCSVDQYVYRIAEDLALPSFVATFMRTQSYLRAAPVTAGPGQLPRIRTEEVARVLIPLPSLDEQSTALIAIERVQSESDRLTRAAEGQLAEINALPAALLRQAFSGEL
jgi:type I restriction enzyme S subunit